MRQYIIQYEYSKSLASCLQKQSIKQLKEMVKEITLAIDNQKDHPALGAGDYRKLKEIISQKYCYNKPNIIHKILKTLYLADKINKKHISSHLDQKGI